MSEISTDSKYLNSNNHDEKSSKNIVDNQLNKGMESLDVNNVKGQTPSQNLSPYIGMLMSMINSMTILNNFLSTFATCVLQPLQQQSQNYPHQISAIKFKTVEGSSAAKHQASAYNMRQNSYSSAIQAYLKAHQTKTNQAMTTASSASSNANQLTSILSSALSTIGQLLSAVAQMNK
jgi:hypothetical protein